MTLGRAAEWVSAKPKRFAWTLGTDGSWSRVVAAPGEKATSAQELLMEQTLTRAKKRR